MPYSSDYFKTRFTPESAADYRTLQDMVENGSVCLLTAYATTGEVWSDEKNEKADTLLYKDLCNILPTPPMRITGYNPNTAHSERGWAITLPLDESIVLANKYRQDAIYYIADDILWIHDSTDDDDRAPAKVGAFMERVDSF